MNLPFIDLAAQQRRIRPAIDAAIARVLAHGGYVMGPEVREFEAALAGFCGEGMGLSCANGTDSLYVAMHALGVKAGDEIITSAHSWISTSETITQAGAEVVFCDTDRESFTIDVERLESLITPRTVGIVPVHLYGRPAEEEIGELAAFGLPVVDDAAHAHGALRGGQTAAAAYSFYPTKNLGGIGDGGAVVTDDAALADKVRLLRHHGMRELYVHEEIATNARMSEIEAAGLRVGLARLDAGNARRRAIAARYRDAAPGLRWHVGHPGHVYHLCVVRVGDREAFRASVGFETGVHYPRAATRQPAYLRFARFACPRAEAWAAECVSLPCFPELSDEEVAEVCGLLAAVGGAAGAGSAVA